MNAITLIRNNPKLAAGLLTVEALVCAIGGTIGTVITLYVTGNL